MPRWKIRIGVEDNPQPIIMTLLAEDVSIGKDIIFIENGQVPTMLSITNQTENLTVTVTKIK